MERASYLELALAIKLGHVGTIRRLLAEGNLEKGGKEWGLVWAANCGNSEVVDIVLAAGVQIDARNSAGETALHCAAGIGHIDIVETLLAAGAEVNVKNSNTAPLFLASRKGRVDVVKLLLSKGALPNAVNKLGATALAAASEEGHLAVVEALIAGGADVKFRSKQGNTALFVASGRGYTAVVSALLAAGADVNPRNHVHDTALIEASCSGHASTVEVLLKGGADLKLKNQKGNYALSQACGMGHSEVVKVLLSHGANIHSRLNDGASMLMLASSCGHDSVVKLLLDKGADINMRRKEGDLDALCFASMGGYLQVVKTLLAAGATLKPSRKGGSAIVEASCLGQTDVVEYLLKAGADVNSLNSYGDTPLIGASGEEHRYTVRLLIDSGADLNIENQDHLTALFIAVDRGYDDIVVALLGAKAVVDQPCKGDGTTALMQACFDGSLLIVELLLIAGADIMLKNHAAKNPRNALQIAIAASQREVAQLLLDKLRGMPVAGETEAAAEAAVGGAGLEIGAGALTISGSGGGRSELAASADPVGHENELALVLKRKVKECSNCDKKGESVKLCNGCHKVPFCSAECLKAAWPTHKIACKQWQKELKKVEGKEPQDQKQKQKKVGKKG